VAHLRGNRTARSEAVFQRAVSNESGNERIPPEMLPQELNSYQSQILKSKIGAAFFRGCFSGLSRRISPEFSCQSSMLLISHFKLETDLKHCVDYLSKHCGDSMGRRIFEIERPIPLRQLLPLFCILRSCATNLFLFPRLLIRSPSKIRSIWDYFRGTFSRTFSEIILPRHWLDCERRHTFLILVNRFMQFVMVLIQHRVFQESCAPLAQKVRNRIAPLGI
jgi:hypothetical protein